MNVSKPISAISSLNASPQIRATRQTQSPTTGIDPKLSSAVDQFELGGSASSWMDAIGSRSSRPGPDLAGLKDKDKDKDAERAAAIDRLNRRGASSNDGTALGDLARRARGSDDNSIDTSHSPESGGTAPKDGLPNTADDYFAQREAARRALIDEASEHPGQREHGARGTAPANLSGDVKKDQAKAAASAVAGAILPGPVGAAAGIGTDSNADTIRGAAGTIRQGQRGSGNINAIQQLGPDGQPVLPKEPSPGEKFINGVINGAKKSASDFLDKIKQKLGVGHGLEPDSAEAEALFRAATEHLRGTPYSPDKSERLEGRQPGRTPETENPNPYDDTPKVAPTRTRNLPVDPEGPNTPTDAEIRGASARAKIEGGKKLSQDAVTYPRPDDNRPEGGVEPRGPAGGLVSAA